MPKVKWVKNVTREITLNQVYNAIRAYAFGLRKEYGVGPDRYFWYHEKGLSTSFRNDPSYKRIQDHFKRFLSDHSNHVMFEKMLKKAERVVKETDNFIKDNKKMPSSKGSLLLVYKRSQSVMKKFWVHYLFPFFVVRGEPPMRNASRFWDRLLRFRSLHTYFDYQNIFQEAFLSRISKLSNTKKDLLFYALPDEIIDFLSKGQKFDVAALKNRYDAFLFIAAPDEVHFYEGLLAINEFNKNIPKTVNKKRRLEGLVAYAGNVKAKAFVAKTKKDLEGMHKDRVLVTHMTTPDFVPYLKHFKAIVTDEGGIACHAAIVSREMQIPCIMGTEFATELIKTGDTIELICKGNIGEVKIHVRK